MLVLCKFKIGSFPTETINWFFSICMYLVSDITFDCLFYFFVFCDFYICKIISAVVTISIDTV